MTPEGNFQRLHPSSLIFGLSSVARAYLIPGILVLFFARGDGWERMAMIFFLPAAGLAILKYLAYSYRLDESEIVAKGGILNRFERNIPYSRIQNINLVQNPFHRMLRVAKVQIETASGEEPEAEMEVIGLDAVAEIRRRVFDSKDEASEADAAEALATGGATEAQVDGAPLPESAGGGAGTRILSLSFADLLLLGLLSNRGLALAAAAFGIASQNGVDVWGEIERRIQSLSKYDLPTPSEATGIESAAWIALGVLGVLAALKLLSIVLVFLRFGGFSLAQHGEDLRIGHGLLTRHSGTVPRRRIQVIGIRETFLQRCLSRFELRARTAGARDEREGIGSTPLAPLAKKEMLTPLLQTVIPEMADPPEVLERAPDRTRRRTIRVRTVSLFILIAIPAWWLSPWWLCALPPILVWRIVSAKKQHEYFGWQVDGEGLWVRQGWPTRTMGIVPFSRIQTVELQQSFFDRRWRVATVRIDTAAAGGASIPLAMRGLDEVDADRLREKLYRCAAAEEFVWN